MFVLSEDLYMCLMEAILPNLDGLANVGSVYQHVLWS